MNFDFPKQIAKEIFDCWSTFASYWPNSKPGRRPPLPVLVELLNNCFFASLKQEEGRSTQFTLVLCSSSDLSNPLFRFSKFTKIFNLIRFKSKPLRPLSVGEIVRLAPACDPQKTLLLAEYSKKSGKLRLWGIVDVGNQSSVTDANLTKLQIRVFSPGEMKVTLHGRTLCTFKDGAIAHPERNLINSGSIYKFFKPTSLKLAREVVAATEGLNIEGQIAGLSPATVRGFFRSCQVVANSTRARAASKARRSFSFCRTTASDGASFFSNASPDCGSVRRRMRSPLTSLMRSN
jgi:hypothetical protein